MSYDPKSVAEYFDALAEQEWDRLGSTLQGRIKHAVHGRFIDESVSAGMNVLDVGCGPGRFAIDLVRKGARVTLADISPGQLQLARQRLKAEKLLDQVVGIHEADVTNLATFDDSQFDVTICFGAAISYTREKHPTAFRELARVTRPRGRVLVSVASLFGTLRLLGPMDADLFLATVDSHLDLAATLSKASLVYTRPGSPEWHQPMVLMTSEGLASALADAGLERLVIAAANPLLSERAHVPKIAKNPNAVDMLGKLEVAVCDHPGLIDSGEHIIAVALRAS